MTYHHATPWQGPPPQSPSYRPQPPGLTRYIAAGVGAVGGVLVVVGSLMPWTAVQSIFGTINLNGTEGDGKITLVAGMALIGGATLTVAFRQRWLRIVQMAGAFLTLALGALEWARVYDGVREATSEYAVASVGNGLYVLLIGAVAAAIAGTVSVAT